MKTRRPLAFILIGAAILGIGLDLMASRTPNPFTAPPAIALGSGQASAGAHCAAPMGR